jgi:uncharacterized delta-60 repeat protein
MIRPSQPARSSRRNRLRPTLDLLEGRALMATTGGLAPSFAASGIYSVDLNPTDAPLQANITADALEPDGSIVEALVINLGTTSDPSTSVGLIHLTASGATDTLFGGAGLATIPLPSGQTDATVENLLTLPNGQIIVQGTTSVLVDAADNITNISSSFLERFNENGTLDTTFGTGGLVEIAATTGAIFTHAALQSNGQIVLAGLAPNPLATNGSQAIGVERLDANGQVDTTFGTNGLVTLSDATQAQITEATGFDESATGLAIAPDGQIIVIGTDAEAYLFGAPLTPEIFRLNADGTQDTSLSQTGLQSSLLNDPVGLAVQPNGQILVIGSQLFADFLYGAAVPAIVVRLDLDGALDAETLPAPSIAFGFDLEIGSESTDQDAGAIAVEPDGNVAITGDSPTDAIVVNQLTPGLLPDPSFGTDGVVTIPIPMPPPASIGAASNYFDYTNSLPISPSGRIIVAGTGGADFSFSDSSRNNIVVEIDSNNPTTTVNDYYGTGISDPAIYLPSYGAFAIADPSGQTTGKLVYFGIPGAGQTIPAPGDYYGTGQTDIAAYLPALGVYAIQDPTGQTTGESFTFGMAGLGNSIPAPGDYYGSGQTNVAVYMPSIGAFAIMATATQPGRIIPFGIAGSGQSIPVPGDYYGTGQDDVAVYLAQSATWAILAPGGQTGELIPFGLPGVGNSIPVPGDYDGSGKTELAVYIPSLAELIYRPANGGADVTVPFGVAGAFNTLPAPGDYDGSGKTEVAAYLPAYGIFAYRPADGGADVYKSIGVPGIGQTLPVTTVALAAFTDDSAATVSAMAFEGSGAMGQADPLDFLFTPESAAKKAKAGEPSTTS